MTRALLSIAILVFSGLVCAVCTYSTTATIRSERNLITFTSVYLEPPSEDRFDLRSTVVDELIKMGYSVKHGKLDNPSEKDLIATFSYYAGWDLTPIVRIFQVRLIDVRTREVIAIGTHERGQNFPAFHRERAVRLAFDALKQEMLSLSKVNSHSDPKYTDLGYGVRTSPVDRGPRKLRSRYWSASGHSARLPPAILH